MVQADKGLAEAAPQPRSGLAPASTDGFDEFFDKTYPLLVKIAMTMRASFHDAEDAANETMAYVLDHWGKIADPRAYARRAVISNVWKMQKRDAERNDRTVAGGHLAREGEDDVGLTAWEDREWVRQRLDGLPPAQSEVVACLVDGMTPAETAETLGKIPATVRKLAQLGRERLKVELALEQEQQQRHQRPDAEAARKETR